MNIKVGDIVRNLVTEEPVTITQIEPRGMLVSLSYTGENSKQANNKIIPKSQLAKLEVLAQKGSFNFEGDPTRFTLFAEAERIHTAYQFDPLFAVNCSIVDPLPHQLEAVYKYLLPLPKIRFLLADDTGAGKTIMTGLLIKELMMRGLVERILIVTPGGLTKQWAEDELAGKFNLDFKLVNRSIFSADPNVFHTANRVVVSIDFISREDVLGVAGNSHWDLVVFDESHKLSAYEYGTKQYFSQRYKAAQVLAKQSEHLLLLTATPHRGRGDTFRMLLQLLDEDIFATDGLAAKTVQNIDSSGVNRFFIRRLKEDMKDWQGQPLFKKRSTKTIAYQLTREEKELYDEVTAYLTVKKEEATESKNMQVSLALTVMQRRLVSSIYAIKNTLEKRWRALQGITEEFQKNPKIFQQRHKLDEFDVDDIEEYEELEESEREALDAILSDPKKFKLFTTAKNQSEIQAEAREVKRLLDMAENLYNRQQAEMKFQKLQELLQKEGTLEGSKKLVIFTEHKDTLLYLEERLGKRGGYKVCTIHGGKSVDERREAQRAFAQPDTQILIATDAAGEGINLQFCQLLINWDIPWNPNRLEQRMGRIHRYGQKEDVLVFNLVANDTREGKVLERLLSKLDIIREGIGDDRVYDVIQDVFQDVSLDDIRNSVFGGKNTAFDDLLSQDTDTLKSKFVEKIQKQKASPSHSQVDFKDARLLKENSDEQRLQPIYIRLFFEKAFRYLGGDFSETEAETGIYRIDKLPDSIAAELRATYNFVLPQQEGYLFCFDKQLFLQVQQHNSHSQKAKINYINPGDKVFDSLVKVLREQFREDMLKGTVLISPDDKSDYFAFFVKSQICDERPSRKGESVVDERLMMVMQDVNGLFSVSSAAKFIDLHPPTSFAKPVTPPAPMDTQEVVSWCFDNVITMQLEETVARVERDCAERVEHLKDSFMQVILNLQVEIQELQNKLLFGEGGSNSANLDDKIRKKQAQIADLVQKREMRLKKLNDMLSLYPKDAQILGCAYVLPLNQVEYKNHYGMSRDDEAEAIAMQAAIDHEIQAGWSPEDVSANNEGYDLRSVSAEQLKRYIEVKGRSGSDGSVMLSENEMNRLAQLGDAAWLYIVTHCKSQPKLHRIQNPAKNLLFQQKSKGVQYFLPQAAWEDKAL